MMKRSMQNTICADFMILTVMEISILGLIGHFSVASQSAPQAVFGRLLSLDWLKQPSLIFCVTILTNNFSAFF